MSSQQESSCCGPSTSSSVNPKNVVGANGVDPVCGMSVNTKTAVHFSHKGKEFSFCSTSCKDKFQKDPDGLLAAKK